jgi:hypothetical protein
MKLNDLLKKAKAATTEAHSKLDEPSIAEEEIPTAVPPRQTKLRYLVQFDKTSYTSDEIRELLPELINFASQTPAMLSTEAALPEEVREELSKHFNNAIDLDVWLNTPNDSFEGKRPLDISHGRLIKTLKGLF